MPQHSAPTNLASDAAIFAVAPVLDEVAVGSSFEIGDGQVLIEKEAHTGDYSGKVGRSPSSTDAIAAVEATDGSWRQSWQNAISAIGGSAAPSGRSGKARGPSQTEKNWIEAN